MDLARYLESRGDDAPSGENLEYDPAFTTLELAAMPGEERQVGDSIIPGEDPDFKEVSSLALEVLERSHDLRAAIFLAHAQLRLNGLGAFKDVLDYIHGCLDTHWETCHPELDEDDGDPTMRVNAVLALADSSTILRALRMVPLSESRTFGRITLRDVQIDAGEITAADGEDAPDGSQISAAFQDSDPEVLSQRLAAARGVLSTVNAIDGVFSDKTPGQGPELDPLRKMLAKIVSTLAEYAPEDSTAEEEETPLEADEDEVGGAAPVAAAPRAASAPGTISSTKDVTAAIDRIIEYYRKHEPSSPVPILLNRARVLVNADFLTILENIAPESLSGVRELGGLNLLDEDED